MGSSIILTTAIVTTDRESRSLSHPLWGLLKEDKYRTFSEYRRDGLHFDIQSLFPDTSAPGGDIWREILKKMGKLEPILEFSKERCS